MREFIVTNLTEAAKVLPYSYEASEYGRFTKGLANTLLLKYYMRVGDWDEAVKIGEELTTNTKYGYALVDNYYDLFSLETEQNTEVNFLQPRPSTVLWKITGLPMCFREISRQHLVFLNGMVSRWHGLFISLMILLINV